MNFIKVFFVWIATMGVVLGTEPAGVVIYRPVSGSSDSLVKVVEYSNIRVFDTVVNFLPHEGGGEVRVPRKDYIGHIVYPDLTKATIANSHQYGNFVESISQLRSVLEKYRRAKSVVEPKILQFESARQIIIQGNVLVEGRWMPKSEYDRKISGNNTSLKTFSVSGRQYSDVKLNSFSGTDVVVMHSGGVASIPLKDLSDEQIEKLNSTSETIKVTRQKAETQTNAEMVKNDSSADGVGPLTARGAEVDGARELDRSSFFQIPLQERLEEIQSKFDALVSPRQMKLDALKEGFDEDEYEKLRKRVSRMTRVIVVAKLERKNFPAIGSRKLDAGIYEIMDPAKDRGKAILVSYYTEIQSTGYGDLYIKPTGTMKVKMSDGFDQTVTVYEEFLPDESVNALIAKMGKLKSEIGSLENEIANLEKIRKLKTEAYQAFDARLDDLFLQPIVWISQRLRGKGFRVGFDDSSFSGKLGSMKKVEKALRERDFEKIFRGDYGENNLVENAIDDLGKFELTSTLTAAGFAPGQKGSFDSSSNTSGNVFRNIYAQVVTVPIIKRNHIEFTKPFNVSGELKQRDPAFRSVRLEEDYLHPEKNGWIFSFFPFSEKCFLFASSGWGEDHSITQLLDKWNQEHREQIDAIEKRTSLGEYSREEAIKANAESLERIEKYLFKALEIF